MSQDVAGPLAFLSETGPRWRGRRWRLGPLLSGLRLAEAMFVLAMGVATAFGLPSSEGVLPPSWTLLAAGVAGGTMFAVAARGAPRLRPGSLAWQMLLASGAGACVLLLLGVATRTVLDWMAVQVVLGGLSLATWRALCAEAIELCLADGRLATHVGVIGGGGNARRTAARLQASDKLMVHVVGRYTGRVEPVTGDDTARGNLRTLLSDCRLGVVDAVVMAMEPDDAAGLEAVRGALGACVQDVYLSAELMALAPVDARVFALGSTPLLLVAERPIKGWAATAKRAFDLTGALLLLAVMAPLLLLIALAIRLETPGPILFRQLRVGYNNQLFHVLKFRSMFQASTDQLAKQQTVHGDTRITRVGRVIRRLSLDELPQLLNVLTGEMSLVGPRPHAPGTSVDGRRVHTLADGYARRHVVRPGITGLAQVRGLRGGLQNHRQVLDRLSSDLEYIDTWSFWLDLRILSGTMVLELRGSHGC